jgi:hypothetical protein
MAKEIERLAAKSGDYFILSEFQDGGLHADFRVVCLFGSEPDGSKPFFKRAVDDIETTEDPEEAEVFLRGWVKWDGCSNWHFPDCEGDGSIHLCSWGQAAEIGVLVKRMYEITAEYIPERAKSILEKRF